MLSSELELRGNFFFSTEKVFTDEACDMSALMLWLGAVSLFALEGSRSLAVVIDGNYVVFIFKSWFFFLSTKMLLSLEKGEMPEW